MGITRAVVYPFVFVCVCVCVKRKKRSFKIGLWCIQTTPPLRCGMADRRMDSNASPGVCLLRETAGWGRSRRQEFLACALFGSQRLKPPLILFVDSCFLFSFSFFPLFILFATLNPPAFSSPLSKCPFFFFAHLTSRVVEHLLTTDMEEPVHLDNLEQLQEKWLSGHGDRIHLGMFAAATAAASPPRIDSPRSLRACALCNIDPATSLERLSLQQHLELVMGDAPWVDRSAPDGVSICDSLIACKEAGVSMGSTQQKVQAYRNFTRHEAARVETLTWVQEVRRQLIAEEMFERRRRAYVERGLQRASIDSTLPPQHGHQVANSLSSQLNENALNHTAQPAHRTTGPKLQQRPPGARIVDTALDTTDVLPADDAMLRSSNPNVEMEAVALIGALDGVCMDRSKSSSNNSSNKVNLRNPVIEKGDNVVLAKDAKHDEPQMIESAPPAPPTSTEEEEEEGEVFYYYCANAVPAGCV